MKKRGIALAVCLLLAAAFILPACKNNNNGGEKTPSPLIDKFESTAGWKTSDASIALVSGGAKITVASGKTSGSASKDYYMVNTTEYIAVKFILAELSSGASVLISFSDAETEGANPIPSRTQAQAGTFYAKIPTGLRAMSQDVKIEIKLNDAGHAVFNSLEFVKSVPVEYADRFESTEGWAKDPNTTFSVANFNGIIGVANAPAGGYGGITKDFN